MILKFDDFEIDPGKCELRKADVAVPIGARTLTLLHLLASHHDRLVSKDEIVETVWDGRAVSDSALSTAIKEARKAVGDDGTRQAVIRTVHGRGFRCVAEVRLAGTAEPAVATDAPGATSDDTLTAEAFSGRPSIAVLPFRHLNPANADDPIGDAIPAELISALSRLRWLAITARGSSFRFRGGDPAPQTVRELLGVRYCLTGIVEADNVSVEVTVELADTGNGNVIWAECFTGARDHVHEIRAGIAAAAIVALELRIPLNEASLARLRGPGNLDAWSEYHLGLQHMYRFNRRDNEISQTMFENAVAREPSFARAHAALSFTAFQQAFMSYDGAPDAAIARARAAAEKSLELDFLDPFANYSMARVDWLTGDLAGASGWVERSLDISPNYAQAHYLHALMDVLAGGGAASRPANATAMALSPLDPLHYAMLATHAMSYLNEGDFEQAADWAERGARAPGAHHHAAVTAAVASDLAGRPDRADFWVTDVRRRRPDMNAANFFRAFPFAETHARSRLADTLRRFGF